MKYGKNEFVQLLNWLMDWQLLNCEGLAIVNQNLHLLKYYSQNDFEYYLVLKLIRIWVRPEIANCPLVR